jgi:hypothetical protein
MLSIFECWVKGNELNNTDLWCLEGEGDTALYKTQSKHEVNNNSIGDTPVYHVWIKGKCVSSITDYKAAYDLYQSRVKEISNGEF